MRGPSYLGLTRSISLRRQYISSHDIDYIEYVGPSLTWGSVISTCVKSMWRNDIKCKYMFMFPQKNLARKCHKRFCLNSLNERTFVINIFIYINAFYIYLFIASSRNKRMVQLYRHFKIVMLKKYTKMAMHVIISNVIPNALHIRWAFLFQDGHNLSSLCQLLTDPYILIVAGTLQLSWGAHDDCLISSGDVIRCM